MESNGSRLDFQRVTKESRGFTHKIADLIWDVAFPVLNCGGVSRHVWKMFMEVASWSQRDWKQGGHIGR